MNILNYETDGDIYIPDDEYPDDYIPDDEYPDDYIPDDEYPDDYILDDEYLDDERDNTLEPLDPAPPLEEPSDKKVYVFYAANPRKSSKAKWLRSSLGF